MPAQPFIKEVWSTSVERGFDRLVAKAKKIAHDAGFYGRSGTIAEKDDYVVVKVPRGTDPREFVRLIMEDETGVSSDLLDAICDFTSTVAYCVELPPNKLMAKVGKKGWLFFGWAICIPERDMVEVTSTPIVSVGGISPQQYKKVHVQRSRHPKVFADKPRVHKGKPQPRKKWVGEP